MTSVKALVESTNTNFIPSNYAYFTNGNELKTTASDPTQDSIPTIDFSLLTSGTPHQRSKAIQDLGKACEDWGFFLVVNHGVPETLVKMMMDASNEFFNLTEEEKHGFDGKQPLDPIRCGSSFHNARKGNILMWRDYLKVFSHPVFHFPNKPIGFSELSLEYCKRTREVAMELLKGVSENLGLEESYMEKRLNLESGLQVFAVNLYPPCPQPELAIGLAPHTDHGVITLLMQNGVGGLQVQHNGKWVHVNAPPNSFMVNVADQLEIFTNGKYKSLVHRAVVNDKVKRISIATAHGPSLDTIVGPDPKFIEDETHPPAYIPMNYKEYMEQQQTTQLGAKPILERVRIQRE